MPTTADVTTLERLPLRGQPPRLAEPPITSFPSGCPAAVGRVVPVVTGLPCSQLTSMPSQHRC